MRDFYPLHLKPITLSSQEILFSDLLIYKMTKGVLELDFVKSAELLRQLM